MTVHHLRLALTLALPALLVLTTPSARAQTRADLEVEARAIEELLIAPCCFSQQVSEHQSAAADEARRDIRARLAAGETRQEILDAYVAQYGNRVLATPPPEGINLVLYVTPVVVLFSSIGLIVLVVRRFSARRGAELPEGAVPAPAWSADVETKLDDELRDLD